MWALSRPAKVNPDGTIAAEKETRHFVQQELTIDGEMQLFGLISEAIPRLTKAGFPFDKLGALFPDDMTGYGPETLKVVAEMATSVSAAAPDLLSRAAAICLGIFPKDIDGKPNRDYDEQVAFIRGSLHVADVVEMTETFIEQNDIERLKGPFERAWEKVTEVPMPTPQSMMESRRTSEAADRSLEP